MNLQELQEECGRLLSDPENTRWTPSVLLIRLNAAQKQVQGDTKAIKTPNSYSVTASQGTVNLDADVMDIYSAYYTDAAGNSFPIDGKSVAELDVLNPGWRQWGEGAPVNFIYDATAQTLQLVPTNSEAITLHTTEILEPADLASASDIPFDSNNQMVPYHMSIVHHAVSQCWMDDGTPEALTKSAFHKSGNMDRPGQYEIQVKRIKAFFDINSDTKKRVMWKPQGGRLSQYGLPTKSYPFRG